MGRPRRNGLLIGVVAATVALVAVATVAAFALRFGPFADDPGPVARNRLNVDFAVCPPDLVVAPGTDVSRECGEPATGFNVQVSAGDVSEARSSVSGDVAFDDLPNGAIRLHLTGVADGTTDILSCRSYAQDERGLDQLMSLVPSVAYGAEPLTASIIAQPYVITGWPDNRWRATAADPTSDQIAKDPSTYGTVFRCTWFLLPPGSVDERPALIRSWTATDYRGEPAIHVLGPGGDGDASSTNSDTGSPPPGGTFTFRSTIDGTTATSGDGPNDHYVLPAGTWAVTDRTTGRRATVDLAPGQTTRVVSVTAIEPLVPGTPAGTPRS